MVRATRILEVIEQDHLVDNARCMGAGLLDSLQGLAAEFPNLVGQVRGRGLMCAVDLPTSELRTRLVALAREEGLLVLPCGQKSIRFRPFLDVTAADIARACEVLGRALVRLRREV